MKGAETKSARMLLRRRPPTSVPAQRRIYVGGPCVDPAGDVCHRVQSPTAQKLGDTHAPATVMAKHKEVLVGWQRRELFGDLSHRYQLRAGNRTDFGFVGF